MSNIHDISFFTQTSTMSPSPSSHTYAVSCHCGTITYIVTLSPPLPSQPIRRCNCSICFRNGYLLIYPPRSSVTFSSDAIDTKVGVYEFNNKTGEHKICLKCGNSVLMDFKGSAPWDGSDVLGLNVSIMRFLFGNGIWGRGRDDC